MDRGARRFIDLRSTQSLQIATRASLLAFALLLAGVACSTSDSDEGQLSRGGSPTQGDVAPVDTVQPQEDASVLLDAGFVELDTAGCPPASSLEELRPFEEAADPGGTPVVLCAADLMARSFLGEETRGSGTTPSLFVRSAIASADRLNDLGGKSGQGQIARGFTAEQDVAVVTVRALEPVFVPGRAYEGVERSDTVVFLHAVGSIHASALMVIRSDSAMDAEFEQL